MQSTRCQCDYLECKYCQLPDVLCSYCDGSRNGLPCDCGMPDDACYCSYRDDRVCSLCNGTGLVRPYQIEWLPVLDDFIIPTSRERVINVILAYLPDNQSRTQIILEMQARLDKVNSICNSNLPVGTIYKLLLEYIPEIKYVDGEWKLPCYWKNYLSSKLNKISSK